MKVPTSKLKPAQYLPQRQPHWMRLCVYHHERRQHRQLPARRYQQQTRHRPLVLRMPWRAGPRVLSHGHEVSEGPVKR